MTAILALVLLTAACSSPAEPVEPAATGETAAERPTERTTPTPTTPALQAFEAPTRFEGTPARVVLPALSGNLAGDFTSSFTLAGTMAYGVTGTSVGAVDLATGETTWETPFPHASDDGVAAVFYDERRPGAPVPSEDGETLYAAVPVSIPGVGTTPRREAFEVMAVEAGSGEVLWSALLDDEYTGLAESQKARVDTVVDGRVVVSLSGQTATLDEADGSALWASRDALEAVTDEAVLVTTGTGPSKGDPTYPTLAGLDPVTGERLWTIGDSQDPRTSIAGTSTFDADDALVVTAYHYTGADPWTAVLDPATGKILRTLDVTIGPVRQDGENLYDVSNGLRALDPETFEPSWSKGLGSGVEVENPYFFAGLVYGRAQGRGVILDGRTGVDVAVDIAGTFVAVNEYGALMLRDGELVFVPATA